MPGAPVGQQAVPIYYRDIPAFLLINQPISRRWRHAAGQFDGIGAPIRKQYPDPIALLD
jgi:hypothetical protein